MQLKDLPAVSFVHRKGLGLVIKCRAWWVKIRCGTPADQE